MSNKSGFNGGQRRRDQLAAECNRIYALLHPTGNVQVILAPQERARLESQYRQLHAQLTSIDADLRKQTDRAQGLLKDIEASLPQMLSMMPADHPWKARAQALIAMPEGKERDDALRTAFSEIATGEAMKRMGPMGVVLGPMIQSFITRQGR